MLASKVPAGLVLLSRWRRVILVTLVAIATTMLITNTASAASNNIGHADSQAFINSSSESPGTLTLTIYDADGVLASNKVDDLTGLVGTSTTEVHLYIQKPGSCGSVSFWELVRNIVRNRRTKAPECENVREAASYLGFQNIDAHSQVTWSDLQPGNYVVEVYHFPGGRLDDQQFWASREYAVQAGVANSYDFVRRTQRSSLKIAVIALVVIPALVAVVFVYQLISATRTVRGPKWSADEVIGQVGRYLTPIAAKKESQGQWAKWLLDNEGKWIVTEQAMAEGWLVTCRSSPAGAALDPNARQFVWVVYKDGREPRPLSPDATWLEGIRTLPPRP